MLPRCHPDVVVLIDAARDAEKSIESQGETTFDYRIDMHLMFRIASWVSVYHSRRTITQPIEEAARFSRKLRLSARPFVSRFPLRGNPG